MKSLNLTPEVWAYIGQVNTLQRYYFVIFTKCHALSLLKSAQFHQYFYRMNGKVIKYLVQKQTKVLQVGRVCCNEKHNETNCVKMSTFEVKTGCRYRSVKWGRPMYLFIWQKCLCTRLQAFYIVYTQTPERNIACRRGGLIWIHYPVLCFENKSECCDIKLWRLRS